MTKSNNNTSDSDSLNLNFSEAEIQRLKKKKTGDFSSNIYKNVLNKGFLIENLSPEPQKVYTDVSSNMTMSFLSESPDSKISSENSPIFDDFSMKRPTKPAILSKFAKNIEFDSFEWKKPLEIRRIIYRRDPKKPRKSYKNMKNAKKSERRKSLESEGKNTEISNKYALEDFDRVKRFSKKERERFQNHIQYLKSVKKITEYKSLSKVFTYIINTLRIISKNELLSKSKSIFLHFYLFLYFFPLKKFASFFL